MAFGEFTISTLMIFFGDEWRVRLFGGRIVISLGLLLSVLEFVLLVEKRADGLR